MITIRKALASDLPAIWALRRAAIHKGCAGVYPDKTLKIWADQPFTDQFKQRAENECHLAILNERIVGTGMLKLDSGQVEGMFVDPEYMGQGIGKQMLTHLETLARTSGLKTLYLDASLNAVPFYHACGFTGHEAAKYRSPRGVTLNCVKMEKVLT